MGYLAGRVTTDALLRIEGDITKESVNEAFRTHRLDERHLCLPWYYQHRRQQRLQQRRPDRLPGGRQHGRGGGLFEIAELPSYPLAEIRAMSRSAV